MNQERLAELKKICEAATVGPWKWEFVGPGFILENGEDNVIDGIHDFTLEDRTIYQGDSSASINLADRELIATARTALPELISYCEQLQEEKRQCLETVIKFERDNEALMDDVEALEAKVEKYQIVVAAAKALDLHKIPRTLVEQCAVCDLKAALESLDSGDK